MSGRMAILEATGSRLRTFLLGPQLLAFVPALTLGGYWLGGETALVVTALILPGLIAVSGICAAPPVSGHPLDAATGLPLRNAAVRAAERFLAGGAKQGRGTAALALQIDDFADLAQRLEPRATDAVLAVCANRVVAALRTDDVIARLEGPRIGVVLQAGTRTELEALIQVAARIQREIEEPVNVDGARIFVTASVGFCASGDTPQTSGEALLTAAEHALEDAALHGAGSIRAFSPDMQKRAQERIAIVDELPDAIDSERIRPWFQPQISVKTGEVTGFEVLARWEHPRRGIVPPASFLAAASDMGLMERLGECMLSQALGALRAWDSAGARVPGISVNFSGDELRNPKLVEKLRWDLDRFGIAPARLTVEVLETVIADAGNDIIVRNLRAFAELGCRIDLDDFGTGHASITNIKRFCVDRIKIDRSFVTQLDTDAEQQDIVAAILTMAGRLGLETLAEGVETPGEHAALKALGCDFIQGFGVARPMPFADVEPWLDGYRKRLARQAAAGTEAGAAGHALPPAPAGKTA